jgi:hypothetical protein
VSSRELGWEGLRKGRRALKAQRKAGAANEEEHGLSAALSGPGNLTPGYAAEPALAGRQATVTVPTFSRAAAARAALLGIAIALFAVAVCAVTGLLLANAIFHPGSLR